MSVTQPPSDAPFGLQPNVAAGLAYLFGILGGLIFFFGGGTNAFVKWCAAQSITLWVSFWILEFVLSFLSAMVHPVAFLVPILGLLVFICWLWTTITAFQGKAVVIPGVGGITTSLFKISPTVV
jgi:uncharacterized membrane protein